MSTQHQIGHRSILFVALFIILIPWIAYAGYLGLGFQYQAGTGGKPSGALVVDVKPGEPAARAGIQPGDLIVAVDGKPVLSARSVADAVRLVGASSPLDLTILREGSPVPVKVILAGWPENMADHQRGLENVQRGSYKQAVIDLTKALDREPGKAESYFYRGKANESQQKYDQALADYSKVIQLDPRAINAYGSRARIYQKMKLYDKAIDDFTKAIEIAPRMAFIYADRGKTYILKGSYDHAIVDCSRAIELEPKIDIAYHIRADAYKTKGRNEEAAVDYERAAKAYIENGLEAAKKGDLDGAFHRFNSAIKLNTKDSSLAYYYRGVAYEKKGDHLRAVNDYSEAIGLNPQFAEAYLRRGYVFTQKLGDHSKAKQDWEKVLELDPQGKTGEAARKSLETLTKIREN